MRAGIEISPFRDGANPISYTLFQLYRVSGWATY